MLFKCQTNSSHDLTVSPPAAMPTHRVATVRFDFEPPESCEGETGRSKWLEAIERFRWEDVDTIAAALPALDAVILQFHAVRDVRWIATKIVPRLRLANDAGKLAYVRASKRKNLQNGMTYPVFAVWTAEMVRKACETGEQHQLFAPFSVTDCWADSYWRGGYTGGLCGLAG